MFDEAKDRYTLNIDCRQSKHRDTHSHCRHACWVFSKDLWSNTLESKETKKEKKDPACV